MRGLTIYVMHTTVKMYLTEDSVIKFNNESFIFLSTGR